MQVHDQRSAWTEEEAGANTAWLDGQVPPQQDTALPPPAHTMIQGQRQYYDEVHVIKEQVQRLNINMEVVRNADCWSQHDVSRHGMRVQGCSGLQAAV